MKQHKEACERKKKGILAPHLRFALAPPDSGFTNNADFCGSCYYLGANKLVYDLSLIHI